VKLTKRWGEEIGKLELLITVENWNFLDAIAEIELTKS
jgi:hypothetical protein